jgi:hypothetical protein
MYKQNIKKNSEEEHAILLPLQLASGGYKEMSSILAEQ